VCSVEDKVQLRLVRSVKLNVFSSLTLGVVTSRSGRLYSPEKRSQSHVGWGRVGPRIFLCMLLKGKPQLLKHRQPISKPVTSPF